MGSPYQNVSADPEYDYRRRHLRGTPYELVNLLPFPVRVYALVASKLGLVAEIPARATRTATQSTNGIELASEQPGYPQVTLHFLVAPGGGGRSAVPDSYSGPEGPLYVRDGRGAAIDSNSGPLGPEFEFTDPVYLRADTRVIRIGDALSEAKFTQTVQRSHSDITGLNVINKLRMPINVYLQPAVVGAPEPLTPPTIQAVIRLPKPLVDSKEQYRQGVPNRGMLLAYIGGNDGTGYHSGSTSQSWVSNHTRGFNMGDQLHITIHFSPELELDWCTVLLNDSWASHLEVGGVDQVYEMPRRDSAGYRVDQPDVIGQRYLHQDLVKPAVATTRDGVQRFLGPAQAAYQTVFY